MKTTAIILAIACVFAMQRADAADGPLKIPATFPTNGMDDMGYPANTNAAFAKGEADARRDWSNGVFTLKTYGLPAQTWSFYEARLMQHCQVKLEPLAGCVVSEGLMNYVGGYNKFVGKQIEQKFGTNIFSQLDKLAAADYEKSIHQAAREHKIRAGDTLTKIAREHGVTLKALQAANPEVEAQKLKVGQIIQIPPPAGAAR